MNNLGYIPVGTRDILPGYEYESLFPMPQGREITLNKDGNVDNTLKYIAQIVDKYNWQVKEVAKTLKASSKWETCKNIWEFVYNHYQYHEDQTGVEQLRTPAKAWADRATGVDCDCMSITIASFLKQLGIRYIFRITKYDKKDFQHIYIVVPVDSENIIIDCVIGLFNYEKQYSQKKDYSFNGNFMNGIPIVMLDGPGMVDTKAKKLNYLLHYLDIFNLNVFGVDTSKITSTNKEITSEAEALMVEDYLKKYFLPKYGQGIHLDGTGEPGYVDIEPLHVDWAAIVAGVILGGPGRALVKLYRWWRKKHPKTASSPGGAINTKDQIKLVKALITSQIQNDLKNYNVSSEAKQSIDNLLNNTEKLISTVNQLNTSGAHSLNGFFQNVWGRVKEFVSKETGIPLPGRAGSNPTKTGAGWASDGYSLAVSCTRKENEKINYIQKSQQYAAYSELSVACIQGLQVGDKIIINAPELPIHKGVYAINDIWNSGDSNGHGSLIINTAPYTAPASMLTVANGTIMKQTSATNPGGGFNPFSPAIQSAVGPVLAIGLGVALLYMLFGSDKSKNQSSRKAYKRTKPVRKVALSS